MSEIWSKIKLQAKSAQSHFAIGSKIMKMSATLTLNRRPKKQHCKNYANEEKRFQ